MATVIVVDFKRARRNSDARRARPFQGALLRSTAARIPQDQLLSIRLAVRDGVVGQMTTEEIVRSILRDQVRQRARAAL